MFKYIRAGNLCYSRTRRVAYPEVGWDGREPGPYRASVYLYMYMHARAAYHTSAWGITVVKIVRRSTLQKIRRRLAVRHSDGAAFRGFAVASLRRFLPSFLALASPNFAIVINDNDSGTSFYYSRGITLSKCKALSIPRWYLKDDRVSCEPVLFCPFLFPVQGSLRNVFRYFRCLGNLDCLITLWKEI